jgi:hypothetical protein
MKKYLAIRGDYQNGNEVIKILEMLGGVNSNNLEGKEYRYFYFIGFRAVRQQKAFTFPHFLFFCRFR